MNATATKAPAVDTDAIIAHLSVLRDPGDVYEIRIPNWSDHPDNKYSNTVAGYFNDHQAAAREILRLMSTGKAPAVYVTLNAVPKELLAVANNRLKTRAKKTTADGDIKRRTRLLIDADPVRHAETSSTDRQHSAALELAGKVRDVLTSYGFPDPIDTDSGNGGGLVYAVDFPAADGGIVERFLKALDGVLSTDDVGVDITVHNAARITKVAGTWARKGEDLIGVDGLEDHPHRMARILAAPETLDVVPTELIKSVTAELEAAAEGEKLNAKTAPSKPNAKPINGAPNFAQFPHTTEGVAGYLRDHGADVRKVLPGKILLNRCPINPDCEAHSTDIAVLIDGKGKISYANRHNRGAGLKWADVRERYEPGYKAWVEGREWERSAADVGMVNMGHDRAADEARATRQKSQKSATAAAVAADALTVPALVRLSDVTSRSVEWLWQNRFALGKLSLVAGDPGTGKSFLSIDIASHVSTGAPWPDDPIDAWREPAGVILLNAEDGIDDTTRPRLDAAGADVTRVVAMEGVSVTDPETGANHVRMFSLERDLARLREALDRNPGTKLIVIDPASAYLGGNADSHKDADVRSLLAPLATLADDYMVAVVLVMHMNKSGGGKSVYRVNGSLAFPAASRAVWLVAKDKVDPERRLFLPIKNNLAKDNGGLAYRINDRWRLEWELEPVRQHADDALSQPDKKSKCETAVEWLREYLANGNKARAEIEREAKAAGISSGTLRRAREALGIVPKRIGFASDGGWWWALPKPAQISPDSQPCAPMGGIAHLCENTPKKPPTPTQFPPCEGHEDQRCASAGETGGRE